MSDFLQTLLQLSMSDPSPIHYSLIMLGVASIALVGVGLTNHYYSAYQKPIKITPDEARLMEEYSIVFQCKMKSEKEEDRLFWNQKLLKIDEELKRIQSNRGAVDRFF